ncbi:hypothetical protein [Flavobacterium marginilacus]|uniref:hypothetical protein n=1 Tax=Flavobacterium marginilacus TaxID=3003256 RepID=UPI00248EA18C|nr:hypothetical protein [Flavobacterium marginilacus]
MESILDGNKAEPPTLATRDLGILLNLKMVLYLGSLGKSERLRIFNPKPLVARERYGV